MNSILKRLRRVGPASLALVALMFMLVPTGTTLAAVANTLSFQGRLLTGPTTPAANVTYQMRFSLWADADFSDGVDRVGGALVGAPWQEVQTVTTDSQGFFITTVGTVTPLPTVFDSALHQYIQAEVKADSAADTTYFLLDNMSANNAIDRKSINSSVYAQNAARLDGRELGFTAGDIPYLDPVTGKLDRTLITDDSWLDPVADEAALPVGGNEGDIVYVQSTDRIYTYDGAAWIKTGGAVDGSISALEGRVTVNEGDISTLNTGLANEITRATAAEGVNATAIATEQTRAEAAESTLTTNLAGEVTRATAAEGVNATAITTEQARAEAAELTLTNALNTENARAIAAELVNSTAINDEEVRALAAEAVNAAAVVTEKDRAEVVEAALQSALDAEIVRATAAEDANTAAIVSNDGELATLNADVNTAGSVLKSIKDTAINALFSSSTGLSSNTLGTAIDEVNQNLSDAIDGLSWKDPVTDVADLATTYTSPAVGDTSYVTSVGEIYTWNGTSWVKTGADFFQDGTEAAKGIVQFATDGEISALRAVQGSDSRLAQVGVNTTNISTNAANITTNASDISTNAAGLASEITRATTAEGVNATAISTETTRATAAEGVNATAITTEQARAEAAELTLTNALNTENARAIAAELVNSTAISAEEVRALAAEAVNAAAVVTEKDRAEVVEAALQSALDAEIARATAAEAANASDISDNRDFDSTGFDVFVINF